VLLVAGGLSWVMGGFVCGQPGFCLDGGRLVSFVGSRAHFVWWVVMVHGLLGWTSHVVSGSAVVVRAGHSAGALLNHNNRNWQLTYGS